MRNRLLLSLTAGLLLLCLTVSLASCTKTQEPTPEDTTMTDETITSAETDPEIELFRPDPERAVPKYDTLMSNLDTFPLCFKYGKTEYNGFAGFALESENYENVDRGVKSTLVLRHP